MEGEPGLCRGSILYTLHTMELENVVPSCNAYGTLLCGHRLTACGPIGIVI